MTNVTKTFGRTTAVKDLDLEVPRGGLHGFIGPNGAGKTTSIRMILSILFPDSGAVSVLGHPSALEAKDRIGYLPEERGLYRKMKVRAFLTVHGPPQGRRRPRSRPPRLRVAGARRSSGDGAARCEELSKGMSQKVQFVAAVIHGAGPAGLGRAFHRPRPGEHPQAPGPDPRGARPRRHGPPLHPRHAPGRGDLRARRHGPQGPQGAGRLPRRHPPAPRPAVDPLRGPSIRRPTPRPWPRCREWRALGKRERGLEIRLRQGTDPSAAMRLILETVPAARIELARPRLEDVFLERASESRSPEEERQLRAEGSATPLRKRPNETQSSGSRYGTSSPSWPGRASSSGCCSRRP